MIENPTNAVADVFRAAYPDTPPEAIESTFRDWWDRYQAFYYDDNEAKTQKRDYQEALRRCNRKKTIQHSKDCKCSTVQTFIFNSTTMKKIIAAIRGAGIWILNKTPLWVLEFLKKVFDDPILNALIFASLWGAFHGSAKLGLYVFIFLVIAQLVNSVIKALDRYRPTRIVIDTAHIDSAERPYVATGFMMPAQPVTNTEVKNQD